MEFGEPLDANSGQGPQQRPGRQAPWQKNFLRVPKGITLKVQRAAKRDLVVACTRKVTAADLSAGMFAHLGVTLSDGGVGLPASPFIPPTESGKYSLRNVDGHDYPRKDLPMVSRTFTVDAPNFGDWSKGSHDVSWSRMVYQREYEAPRNLDLSVDLLNKSTLTGQYLFKFSVNAVLRRGSPGFDDELLYALNLLQENVGAVDVFVADATREDYLKTVHVAWELLPVGEREATIKKLLSRYKNTSEEFRARLAERYDLLTGLKPLKIVQGTSGFQRYFGAQFADDLVVFENLEYGNAIYVMFEDWQTLSRQSRLELLKGDPSKFHRIIHSKDWKTELMNVVAERRPETKH